MSDATVSTLGIYVTKGQSKMDDVYYYATDQPDQWMMVPAAHVFIPSEVHRPPEDREAWHAIGSWNDNAYGDWITTDLMALHGKRITNALRTEVRRRSNEVDQWKLWYQQERDRLTEGANESAVITGRRTRIVADIQRLLNELEA